MIGYKKWKEYEGDSVFFDYCNYVMITVWGDISGAVKSLYFCIRFPFLYPRNAWTGKHYNSKASEKRSDLFRKWNEYSQTHQKEYYEKFGEAAINLFGEPIRVYTDEVLKRSNIYPEYVMKLASFSDRVKYIWYGFEDVVARVFHCIPTYSWYDYIPVGWRKRFGIDFCKELRRAIIHSGGYKYLFTFWITDIKEKYGQFECYNMGSTDEVDRVIDKYHYISQYVCIECGEDATKRTVFPNWISPYCDKCLSDGKKWLYIDHVYGWTKCDLEKKNEEIKKGWYE